MTGAAVAVDARLAKRAGAGHWVRSFAAMLRWEVTSMRLLLPLIAIVQLLLGAGFVFGIGLLFVDIPARTALFLSTGAGVITLIVVGLVLGPQLIANQKEQGTYDFMWSLPVPRSSAAAAWVVLNVIIAVPGLIGALVAGVWHFGLDIDVGWDVVTAVSFTLVTATLLGYVMAHAIPNPQITQILSQLFIFLVVGFAPINFPPENLPSWLVEVHEWLPFTHMAVVVRHSLTEGLVADVARSYVVLSAWAVTAVAVSVAVVRRRG